MNLILLETKDFVEENRVRLTGRRFQHVRDVHKAEPGMSLRVGLLDAKVGSGLVREVSSDSVEMEISLFEDPPPPLPLNLVLALPRPKFLRRILQAATSLGVKRIDLVHSYRVEKSYWHCEQIEPASVRTACLRGLEQARDTRLPAVMFHRRLKPFVQDSLPALIGGRLPLIAHPIGNVECPSAVEGAVTLAIGPEGGWIDYEINLFREIGFTPVTLGARILSVETSIPALIGRICRLK